MFWEKFGDNHSFFAGEITIYGRLGTKGYFLVVYFQLRKFIEGSLQKFLLQRLNHSIYLVRCFFQMLAVVFVQEPTGIAALIFLPTNAENWIEP